METELLLWTMVAIVGTVGVIKNLIPAKGNKVIWTIVTLVVGAGVGTAACFLPVKVMQVWVAVTGATLFYDTVFQSFKKLIEKLSDKGESNER